MNYDQTHWVPVQQRRPLPTFYYHEHFVEMLEFVGEHYKHALFDTHIAFLNEFKDLSREAQCLYVRLVNRKGRIFAVNRLRYPELGESGRYYLNCARKAGSEVPPCCISLTYWDS